MSENQFSFSDLKKFSSTAAWAIKQLYNIAPLHTVTLGILTIINQLTPALSAYVGALLIDQVIELATNPIDATTLLTTYNPASRIILFVGAVSFTRYILKETAEYIENKFKAYHIHWIHTNYGLKMASLDIAAFEHPETANDIIRGWENIYNIRSFFSAGIYLLANISGTVVNFVILSRLHILFPIFIIATILPSAIFFMQWIQQDWGFDKRSTERRKVRWWAYSGVTESHVIAENKSSGALQYLAKILKRETEFIFGGHAKIRKKLYTNNLLASSVLLLSEFVTIIYPLTKVLSGHLSVGDFTFYTGRARQLGGDTDGLLSNISTIYSSLTRLESSKKVMEMKNSIIGGEKKIRTTTSPKIEFKNVSFKYPGSKGNALKDFSITINPGEEIAIVGQNGAGKTTFIKLLLRFYDPQKGEILINGINIKELDLDNYYNKIGALFQDYLIHQFLTIDENVTIGTGKEDQTRINDSLNNADAWDFVKNTKLKGKHKLSKQFKDGIQLSKGQEQKIALARMFYRDSPILILDEPTASIDAVAEYKIFKHIYSFMKNKTVIIVSHRFSTVRNAQKIYIFDKGRIIEEGSHKELLEKNGVYAKAFKLQAEGYTN